MLLHAVAQHDERLPAPLIGARGETAVALAYDAGGPARLTRERIDQAVRQASAAGFARVVIYGGETRIKPPAGAAWSFVAVREVERAMERRERERGRIVMDVARRLAGFRYLGGQFGPIIVGQDDHGAVGVIWRESGEGITREDWQAAVAEARQLGLGPALTLIGTRTTVSPSGDWRFVQIARRRGRWVPLRGLETPDASSAATGDEPTA